MDEYCVTVDCSVATALSTVSDLFNSERELNHLSSTHVETVVENTVGTVTNVEKVEDKVVVDVTVS